MKINLYQKLILTFYAILFIYFSIFHVPFKYGDEIEYDTLFSNKSNLDIARFILIILVISILTFTLLLLLRNVNFKISLKLSRKKIILTTILIAVIAVITILVIGKYWSNKESIVAPVDSTTTVTDTTISIQPSPSPSLLDVKKAETCTTEHALKNFQSYMKFYYPDWKIYGQPVVKEQSDCTYRIQFTTKDPHMQYLDEKEIMIVEISYNYDYTRYSVREIRGTLY